MGLVESREAMAKQTRDPNQMQSASAIETRHSSGTLAFGNSGPEGKLCNANGMYVLVG